MAEFPRDPPIGKDAFDSLDKGANTRAVEWALDGTSFEDGVNIDQSRNGVWGRRGGVLAIGGIEDVPGGLGAFREQATDEQVAWGIFGSQLYRTDGDGLWEEKACGVSLVRDRLHMFVEGNWVAAGGDQRALYGSQAAPSSGVTEASGIIAFRGLNAADFSQNASYAPICVTYFQNRLWKGSDQVRGDGNDVAWSELDDGLTFSPANELSIEPGLGGRVTALMPARDNSPKLWVFKEEAIILFSPQWGSAGAFIPGTGDELDTINSSVRILTAGVGCVATKSVVWVPGLESADVLFLARDGVRSLQRAENDVQTGAGLPLTYDIPRWIARINFDFAHKAVGRVFENAYHLAVPMDGAVENTHVLVYDLFQNSWKLHDLQMRDLENIPFSNEERLYFQNNFSTGDCSVTGAAAGASEPYQTYRAFVGSDDPGGSPVGYELITKAFAFGDINIRKRWDELSFCATVGAGERHDVEIAYKVNREDWFELSSVTITVPPETIVLGQTPLTWAIPDQSFVVRRVGLQDAQPGYFMSLRFKNNTDFAQPEFYRVQLTAAAEQEIHDNSL